MLNSLAYLGFSDIRKIEDMTFDEYNLRIEAYQLKQIKEQEKLALLAWFNQTVQATTGNAKHPKPKYKKFTDFFDAMEMIDVLRDEFEEDYKLWRCWYALAKNCLRQSQSPLPRLCPPII